MTTARDIIKSMLRKIHVLGTGSSLDPTEAEQALSILNDLLSTSSIQSPMVYTETIETFSLTEGDNEYTIGSGGDFDTTRPLKINAAYVTQEDNDYTLTPIDKVEYSEIWNKSISTIPSKFYYNENYPLGTIWLNYLPISVTTITLTSEKPLTQFTDLDTAFSMPPEYKMFLEFNGAVLVAPEYEREASQTVKNQAKKIKRLISIQNRKNDKFVSTLGGIPYHGDDECVDIRRRVW